LRHKASLRTVALFKKSCPPRQRAHFIFLYGRVEPGHGESFNIFEIRSRRRDLR
jgi:hypothetical protein